MPPPDVIFCSQQINIPPELPDILKQFTKAAIRTQPNDVLAWSSAYFNSLSKGQPLPVKNRLEIKAPGLTPGLLEVIYNQLKDQKSVTFSLMSKKWSELGLPKTEMAEIITAGGFAHEFSLIDFLSVACSHLGGHNISDALKVVCSIITEDPDGGPDRIPFKTFKSIYQYLADLSGDIPQSQMDEALAFLKAEAKKQDGLVMPRNFTNLDCPKLY